jgi:hypothetical protein
MNDFFTASASVAGALIGLLFVAISVASDRLRAGTEGQVHRIRAVAALTAFTNSLSVSLFSLIPGHKIGPTAISVAAVGLTFVLASLLSLIRLRRQVRWTTVRDALFLIGLAFTFVIQLLDGIDVTAHPGNSGDVDTIAILVVICFLLGIGRSWELIGGPSIGIRKEVAAMVRAHQDSADEPHEAPAAPAAPVPPDATTTGETGPA